MPKVKRKNPANAHSEVWGLGCALCLLTTPKRILAASVVAQLAVLGVRRQSLWGKIALLLMDTYSSDLGSKYSFLWAHQYRILVPPALQGLFLDQVSG